MGVGVLGGVEDGAVAAEADEEIGVLELLLHVPVILALGELHVAPLLQGKGEAKRSLRSGGAEDVPGPEGRLQATVPVGVGAEHHLHRCLPPSSSAWEASTRADRSPV